MTKTQRTLYAFVFIELTSRTMAPLDMDNINGASSSRQVLAVIVINYTAQLVHRSWEINTFRPCAIETVQEVLVEQKMCRLGHLCFHFELGVRPAIAKVLQSTHDEELCAQLE
jgi:hypothetical protein